MLAIQNKQRKVRLVVRSSSWDSRVQGKQKVQLGRRITKRRILEGKFGNMNRVFEKREYPFLFTIRTRRSGYNNWTYWFRLNTNSAWARAVPNPPKFRIGKLNSPVLWEGWSYDIMKTNKKGSDKDEVFKNSFIKSLLFKWFLEPNPIWLSIVGHIHGLSSCHQKCLWSFPRENSITNGIFSFLMSGQLITA